MRKEREGEGKGKGEGSRGREGEGGGEGDDGELGFGRPACRDAGAPFFGGDRVAVFAGL